jgi:hypothetical protein
VGPSSTTFPESSAFPFPGAQRTLRACKAAEFICFELRGSKQAGGFTEGSPLASSPYSKTFRVSTSKVFRPRRCGTIHQAWLNPNLNRAPVTYSTFVLAIKNTIATIPQTQEIFLRAIKNFYLRILSPLALGGQFDSMAALRRHLGRWNRRYTFADIPPHRVKYLFWQRQPVI